MVDNNCFDENSEYFKSDLIFKFQVATVVKLINWLKNENNFVSDSTLTITIICL